MCMTLVCDHAQSQVALEKNVLRRGGEPRLIPDDSSCIAGIALVMRLSSLVVKNLSLNTAHPEVP